MRHRLLHLTISSVLILSLLSACGGAIPLLSTPTPQIPTPTAYQQALPPRLVETDPPMNTVIGHLSPITFYFNQAMNKPSVEAALGGLPEGTFTWNDESTLVFQPRQPYSPNSELKITIASSIQTANGFGIQEPIELSFTVADYLQATNVLPKQDTTDADVRSAVIVSFNQPVVPLGADAASLPAAFSLQPFVSGSSEWINTSTFAFYPEPAMAGGTEYTLSLNPDLKTVTGVGLEGGAASSWSFTTSRPRVVLLEPPSDQKLPLDPEIKLTFNQPMNTVTVESYFSFRGPQGAIKGTFQWNDDATVLTFRPNERLARNVGYILNVSAAAQSKGGMTLGEDYGAVLSTFDNFAVVESKVDYGVVTLTFSSPLARGDYDEFVNVNPDVDNFSVSLSEDALSLYLYGNFLPETNYVIELAGTLRDQWEQSLGDSYILDFRTAPAPAMLTPQLFSSSTAFVRPDEPVLYAKAVNVAGADVTVAPLTIQDFFSLQTSYENQQAYVPAESTIFQPGFTLQPSQTEDVQLPLARENTQLLPGLYYVGITSPQITPATKGVYFAVSSQVNLTFKLGATEAMVWAVDLPSQTPVANAAVSIYDNAGNTIATGTTDEDGLWKGPISSNDGQLYAMLGAPGDENFGLAFYNWNMGVGPWDFGYAYDGRPPRTVIYMYTDRPMYRPGQTVYFRGVVRQAFNGRYELPPRNEVPITLHDVNGTQLLSINAQLSPYGTFSGEYKLSEAAAPGYYTFDNPALGFFLNFQVAEYRKPEIDLSVDFAPDEIQLGETATARVNTRYFFDAPAANVNVNWALYVKPSFLYLPNYETSLLNTSWLDLFPMRQGDSSYFGQQIGGGTGQTNRDGTLSIELPAIPESESGQVVTLEVTVQDELGLPVSARAQLQVHPAEFYIGLRPDQWIGRADSPVGFDVYTVDWTQKASGDQSLTAEFKQVRWEKETNSFGYPTYRPVYTPVSSSNLATGPDGRARLSFVPPTAGTYMLEVSGDGTRTQSLIWVGGAGAAAWPDLPNQRFELTADKDSYKAGETAKIFIPNPFAVNSLALVTVERGVVAKAEVISVSGSGREYSLPLTEADAPNVYVSVTILGQGNDFRGGLVNLPVAPDDKELNVQVTSNPGEAGPRDEVTFDVQVTDNQGQPVEGEFSLSVVDLASLAVADPNSQDILPAFYSNQPLGIQTGLSVAAYTGRDAFPPGGMGGGGGEDVPFLREEFPDTAYWNPSLITNSEGRGQVKMTLPDSLTTWQVDVRGLTVDTKVGQAETQIVSTKPLLIRPVTPRFLVNGDHVLMAAIINNNTSDTLTVNVSLQSEGFVLDEPGHATKQVNIPANGRMRVEWWGSAGSVKEADLIFSATTTGSPALEDSTRPVWGKLPVLQYTAPQAFVTGGVLRGASSQQEVISLPRTFTPTGGGLDVELSPSLAGSLLSALEAVEDIPDSASAEAILSYFLPNLEVYRTINGAGLNDPNLTDRVAANVDSGVQKLLRLQNEDGGWNWWGSSPIGQQTTPSDPYISAYVTFGLIRAHAIGVSVDQGSLQLAGTYLRGLRTEITNDASGAELDQIAFVQFVLAQASTFDEMTMNNLYNVRDRLSPSSRAMLAYIINAVNPADERVRELISNLETSAIITSSSSHWETPRENIISRGSPIYTTSLVVYVLAKLDPANQVVFNAVRYLAAHRNARGLWGMGHDNAWALLALNEAMIGFGDLNADFGYNATFNGGPLVNGDIAGNQILTSSEAQVPLEYVSSTTPNLLTIQREDGLGRLYYRAVLNINRPVEDVRPLNAGMRIDRVYCDSSLQEVESQSQDCTPLSSLQLGSDQTITTRLTLVLPNDAHYVMVEDFIPAGMEVLNRNLKTSQQAEDPTAVEVQFDDKDPFANGWGWWLFHEPQIRDDRILFAADYLPAGTYVLTYTLVPLQAGQYRLLPAHAWESFFPEVQGTSAGAVFEIKP